jgi:long-chain acyl-CoA synthetase
MTQLFKHIAGPNPAASSARSVTMEFDATSLFLASAVLAITYLTVNRPEPDVHPFILSEQSVPAGVRQRGESAIYRSRLTPHGTRLPVFPDANTRTIVDIFRKGKGRSEAGQGNCLGGKYANGMWRWLSYAETERRILNFGSGLLNFTELKPNTENNMIGIYMRNSPEWIIADLAAAHYSLVTVPLYPAWALDSIRSCIQQTGLTTLVTTERELPGVLSICQECPTLRWIIVANGTPSAENVDRAQRLGVSLETFAALENIGRTNPIELVLPSK